VKLSNSIAIFQYKLKSNLHL